MMHVLCRLLIAFGLVAVGFAAPRQHTVILGRWRTVPIATDSGAPEQAKLRQLLVDDRLREYTAGDAHQITDRIFVIRRAQRLNDSLPEEAGQKPRWIWRLDGWISVDRQTGHLALLNLPMFDPETSQVTWFRDYAAYCGSSDDGSKTYMMVFQLGKRKPILKKEFAGRTCPAPTWERTPSRVTFNVAGAKSSFVVNARGADLQPESNDEQEGPQ
jgi:hypothetical protein